ncbi:NUDIX domain-containing protein [Bosea sp. BH3]|uniref:NUDIX domain-containing protein n=1 Tax=Bosea sp. BH3 TaxID=2871701 RepID=UPI0021CB05FC|nr:NUDIX domain-containing protein [Bosea sp. BH3]MCU4179818.1 NUDIX domain-containing protein [Bosea sp. BH3]
MNMADRVDVTSVQTLSEDWAILRKTEFRFRRRDGTWQQMARETYDRGDGAAILLFDPDRQLVLLTRQFRYAAYVNGHDGLMIEAAAGLLDGADPATRIRAEVEEETGYRIHEILPVFQAFMSPGSVTERLHFFIGIYSEHDRIGEGGGLVEEGEDIERVELPLDAALAMIGSGEICDAKTIMLLQFAAIRFRYAGMR